MKGFLDINTTVPALVSRKISAVYCDGSGTQRVDCGYGVVVLFNDGSTHEFGGWEPESTNQRSELLGLIRALEVARLYQYLITIYTDSGYCCNGYNQRWFNKWNQNGWINSEGEPVKNDDLWRRVANLHSLKIQVAHLKGHSDRGGKDGVERRAENQRRYGAAAVQHNAGNIKADQIASQCRLGRLTIDRAGEPLLLKGGVL